MFKTSPNLSLGSKENPRLRRKRHQKKQANSGVGETSIPQALRHYPGGLTIGWVWGIHSFLLHKDFFSLGGHKTPQIWLTLGNGTDPVFGATHGCGGPGCFQSQTQEEPKPGTARAQRFCNPGCGSELLIFISVILWFSRNMTKQSQIMKSPTFSAVHSRLSGANSAPTFTALIELYICGWGRNSVLLIGV